MNKVYPSPTAALDGLLLDSMTGQWLGGFGLSDNSESLIPEIRAASRFSISWGDEFQRSINSSPSRSVTS